jgi:hypothetical protein
MKMPDFQLIRKRARYIFMKCAKCNERPVRFFRSASFVTCHALNPNRPNYGSPYSGYNNQTNGVNLYEIFPFIIAHGCLFILSIFGQST